MKKLIFILLLFLPAVALALNNQLRDRIALMAKDQIINCVRLPVVTSVFDSSWIRRAPLDRMIMKFRIKPNGRVDVGGMEFLYSSVDPINGRFEAALQKV